MSYELEYGAYRDKPLAFLRDNDPDYSDAVYLKTRWPKTFDLVKSTSYDESAHAGAPEDKANYEFWKETYASTEGKSWWDLGHRDGILVRIPLLSKDERESYEYLEDNFELDEDRTQTIRNEVEMEAWDDYGRKEYKDAIKKGMDEEDEDAVEALLDAIPDGAFDAAAFDMWSRSGHYPEVSGWEVNIPDADNLLTHDENFTGWDLDGLINWLGIGHEVTVRLSPRAFCRLSAEDRDIGYPGAVYIRYGEEWVLNITMDDLYASTGAQRTKDGWVVNLPGVRGAPIDYDAIGRLLAMHMDDKATFHGFDNAPSVTMMYNSALCKSPFVLCDIDYIEAIKLEILQGPSAEWDAHLAQTDEEEAKKKYDAAIKAQQSHSEMVQKVRDIAIDGALEVCDIDPTPDLVERVVEQLILGAPDRGVATLDYPPVREHLKKTACDYTKQALDQRPPVCNLRQLKLPMASEKRRRRRA